MLLRMSDKAERPRLRGLLLETLEVAQGAGIDPTNIEVRVYDSPPGKRNYGVFQYVDAWVRRGDEWRRVSGRILLQPRRGATDREIVRLFAHELGHLRDFQDDRACCYMDRDEKERRAREFATEILELWERQRAMPGRLPAISYQFEFHWTRPATSASGRRGSTPHAPSPAAKRCRRSPPATGRPAASARP